MTQPDDTQGSEPHLTLADWRRQIADLYAAVREHSDLDPEAAWGQWCLGREQLYRDHPQSPVPAASRAAFRSLYWPYDPAMRFEVTVQLVGAPAGPGAPEGPRAPEGPSPLARPLLALPMGNGAALDFTRIGEIEIPFAVGIRSLSLYWIAGYAGGLFLPFCDSTNGTATYGAGRYLLDTAKGADPGGDVASGHLTVDFNFAFHPSCAFDPAWSCPLAPPENRLDLAIEAGERLR